MKVSVVNRRNTKKDIYMYIQKGRQEFIVFTGAATVPPYI